MNKNTSLLTLSSVSELGNTFYAYTLITGPSNPAIMVAQSLSGQLPEWAASRKPQSRMGTNTHDKIPNGLHPEWRPSRIAQSRIDTIPNGHRPYVDTVLIWAPSLYGHHPEWKQSQMYTITNGNNPEWKQSRMNTIPNGQS